MISENIDYNKLSIIIPTHNEGIWLKRTVDSIIKSVTNINYEIIIIADYITDDSDSFLNNHKYEEFNIIKYDVKFASLCKNKNYGAQQASGDILLFLDSHVIVNQNAIESMIKMLQMDNIGLASVAISVWGDENNIGYIYTIGDYKLNSNWAEYDSNEVNAILNVPCIIGACMAVKRSVFFEIGMFRDNYTRWGIEDVEISVRSWMAGYDNIINPNVNIIHLFKQKQQYTVKHNDIDVNGLMFLGHLLNEKNIDIMDAYQKEEHFSNSLSSVLLDKKYWNQKEEFEKIKKRTYLEFFNTFEKYLYINRV